MKQVPYKCEFGHITIIKFLPNQETTGTTVCNKCMNDNDPVTFTFGNKYNSGKYTWFGKKQNSDSSLVMAVRF